MKMCSKDATTLQMGIDVKENRKREGETFLGSRSSSNLIYKNKRFVCR